MLLLYCRSVTDLRPIQWSLYCHMVRWTHCTPLLFPEEANVHDHCQHFLYARLKKKYARPEEFTDHSVDYLFGNFEMLKEAGV